jgi:hypothetical protein
MHNPTDCDMWELGHTFAINTLSAFNAAPRKGHLMRVYGLIGCLRQAPEIWIMIDSSDPGRIPGEEYHPFNKVS